MNTNEEYKRGSNAMCILLVLFYVVMHYPDPHFSIINVILHGLVPLNMRHLMYPYHRRRRHHCDPLVLEERVVLVLVPIWLLLTKSQYDVKSLNYPILLLSDLALVLSFANLVVLKMFEYIAIVELDEPGWLGWNLADVAARAHRHRTLAICAL